VVWKSRINFAPNTDDKTAFIDCLFTEFNLAKVNSRYKEEYFHAKNGKN